MLAFVLIGLSMAGPMMEKISPKRADVYTQQSQTTKPTKAQISSYPNSAGTYYYTTPASSYKTEAPEYYTTPKQYSTTPQPYPMKETYSSP